MPGPASLDHAPSPRKVDTLDGGIVHEPAHFVPGGLVDQPAGQLSALLRLEDLLQDVFLAGASRDERDLGRVADDGQAQADALGRGFGGVGDGQDPGVGLAQGGVVGEQRAGVAVGPAAQQDEVEERQLDGVARGEDGHQLLLVLVRQLLHVVQVLRVDGEDLGRGGAGGDLVQQFFLHQLVVRVLMIERHAALIGVEDLPLLELDAVVGVLGGGRGEEGFGQRLGEGAAGDGDAEDIVTFDGFGLLLEDILAEVGGQIIVDRGEGEEARWTTHGGGGGMIVLGGEWRVEGDVGEDVYIFCRELDGGENGIPDLPFASATLVHAGRPRRRTAGRLAMFGAGPRETCDRADRQLAGARYRLHPNVQYCTVPNVPTWPKAEAVNLVDSYCRAGKSPWWTSSHGIHRPPPATMTRSTPLARPPKKPKFKVAVPVTADDFQEAADVEEDTGGKWRAGDPAKSGRAFVRALEIYDKGLQKHAGNFDLAYNKARLQLEVTQQPALVAHIGVPIDQLLKQTLDSHRYALKLNASNPDILFNTAQVLSSLAELLAEQDDTGASITLLHEALELLSACLSRQEILLEQHRADFPDADEGGVMLEPDEQAEPTTTSAEVEEQSASIESPVTASDLLDTLHSSIATLTTLVPLVEESALQFLGDSAQNLTDVKAPQYLKLLSPDDHPSAQFTTALDRAIFIATFADAQFNAGMIEMETYISRLAVFEIAGKDEQVTALSSEGEARTELALSLLQRFEGSPDLPATTCWSQLKLAQDLYTRASKLESSSALHLSRGDVEMYRYRIATNAVVQVSESIRKAAPTLAQNAQTYYKGAAKLVASDDEDEMDKALQRLWLATDVRRVAHGVEPAPDVVTALRAIEGELEVSEVLEEFVEDGLIDALLAEKLIHQA
nr:upf0656 protein [Quercus suber]